MGEGGPGGPAKLRGVIRVASRAGAAALALVVLSVALAPAAAAAGLVAASRPEQGATVTARKPRLAVEFAAEVDPGSLVAVLDGADITQISRITSRGLEYAPVVAPAPGSHTLTITARRADGTPVSGTLSFASRHSSVFEKVGAEGEIGLSYEHAVKKPGGQITSPDEKVEGILNAKVTGSEGGLSLSASANLAYLRQRPATPVVEGAEPYPPEEEINLMDYLLSAAYRRDGAGVTAEVGTLSIDHTERTISGLSRRGSRLSFSSGMFDAGGFMVRSASTVELEDPAGVGGAEDHVYGFTAGLRLFEGRTTLKGVYVRGGDLGTSAGIAGGTPLEGQVYGGVLATDFFRGRFTTELEADVSSSEVGGDEPAGRQSDQAYAARAAGTIGVIGYDGGYEWRGRDFRPIGNLMLEPDRDIAKASLSATLPTWRVGLGASRTEDNVENDPSLPRVATLQGTVDASYTGLAAAPFGVSYQHSLQESSHEIEDTLPVDTNTATLSGWANLTWRRLALALQASRSSLNDANAEGTDTATATYTVAPSLDLGQFALKPNYTFARAKNEMTGVATDTQVGTLDVRASLFGQRLTCDLAGSWSANKADDASLDTRSLDANARVALTIGPFGFWPAKVSLALKGLYTETDDKIGGEKTDDLALHLAVSAAIPLFPSGGAGQ